MQKAEGKYFIWVPTKRAAEIDADGQPFVYIGSERDLYSRDRFAPSFPLAVYVHYDMHPDLLAARGLLK